MLYHLLYPHHHLFNIFKYITFRTGIAFLIATVLSIIWGHYFIDFMKKKQFGQIIRSDGPESHFKKKGTPTMGGVFMLGSIFVTTLICGNFFSMPLKITLGVTFSYFLLGFYDDYLKVLKKDTKGVSAKGKLVWQFGTALAAMYVMVSQNIINTDVYFPFFKSPIIDLGYWYILFGSIVIVGFSNAVNLTDGLDGLAIGPIMVSAATMGLLTYVTGHKEISQYLYIPYFEGMGEITVLTAAIIGAGIGFLWYNSYPAQIFMGDVGSLSLGGTLGTIAVLAKSEFLFVVIGGIFVIEALSVIIQVASFKTRGVRVFKMAPIHHHFEKLGWPETKVTVRFWIISVCLAIMALSTLKTR
ncbi:phospho-N-acetylmuramoyl-pentapeptide-transferase [Bacteriovorax stolpii]|uniref:Phospho-N-acetylmuramoyl-pentapeptide-transferase n=1 Tax=Bacteriovorax stolpii TaxID=960 RepID=A0A2K9NM69_BACTC|nr:phospho-N-acetylmuramoyl-pentapeptide-transferase [Bacteriovorax stolpii]AUN96582.1 phospho-N-acetylmuramoyl-pentapeptide-transferase [Bacteriovorax stolpii]QDK43486.1 phospho-N-acetylmuramoyl-pentapeptide-transferase [Bacteriovorax stolpii]TDP53897.1 phospho-N-acetylmuramoyl-pentapeptide-transferase [Bacteriovorax stolpii]